MLYTRTMGGEFTARAYQPCGGIALGGTGYCGSCGAYVGTTDGRCGLLIEIVEMTTIREEPS